MLPMGRWRFELWYICHVRTSEIHKFRLNPSIPQNENTTIPSSTPGLSLLFFLLILDSDFWCAPLPLQGFLIKSAWPFIKMSVQQLKIWCLSILQDTPRVSLGGLSEIPIMDSKSRFQKGAKLSILGLFFRIWRKQCEACGSEWAMSYSPGCL